jgi:hypothetical protein
VSRADQQIPGALLPDTHQSGAARTLLRTRSGNYLSFVFNHLLQLAHGLDPGWHGARTIGQRAGAQTSIQLNILTLFGELK